MEQIIFNQIELNRSRTLEIITNLTSEQVNVTPNGYNNNILWHVGHILTTQERLSYRLIQEPLELPESLMALFLNGTKPADWQTPPPDMSTLLPLLKEQPTRMKQRLEGRLEEQITIPFKDLKRLGEVLIFSIGHEALHVGYIMAMKKLVGSNTQ
jgi:hypothetical protein